MSSIVALLFHFLEAMLKLTDEKTRRYYVFNKANNCGKDVANLVATYSKLRESLKSGYFLDGDGVPHYVKDYPILNVFQPFVAAGRVFAREDLIDVAEPLFEFHFNADVYSSLIREEAAKFWDYDCEKETYEAKSNAPVMYEGMEALMKQLVKYEASILMPEEVTSVLNSLKFEGKTIIGNIERGISLSKIDSLCEDGEFTYSLTGAPNDLEKSIMQDVHIPCLHYGCKKISKPTKREIVTWMFDTVSLKAEKEVTETA